jgi:hypothetical protein
MWASSWRSISRAAQAASPAASAWRMASSARSWASCQAAAARCSSGTRSGCCTYTFKYRIDGNRLTVDVLQNDPHFIATWEATPFYRTS